MLNEIDAIHPSSPILKIKWHFFKPPSAPTTPPTTWPVCLGKGQKYPSDITLFSTVICHAEPNLRLSATVGMIIRIFDLKKSKCCSQMWYLILFPSYVGHQYEETLLRYVIQVGRDDNATKFFATTHSNLSNEVVGIARLVFEFIHQQDYDRGVWVLKL